MSGTEDYLDGLLNSISEKDLDTKKKTGSETMQTEEDIMNDMENDLLSKEAEDNFLEQFEKELQNEKSSPEEEKTDDFFNSLDQIVDGADHNNNDDDFTLRLVSLATHSFIMFLNGAISLSPFSDRKSTRLNSSHAT